MLKDIIVFIDAGGDIEGPVAAGLALATADRAHLSVVALSGVPFYQEYFSGAVLYDGYQQEVSRAREQASSALKTVRAMAEKAGVGVEVRSLVADIDLLPADAAVQGRYADVNLIASQPGFADRRLWDRMVQALLFDTGRPVMIAPEGSAAHLPPKCLALGWNATSQAARAIHDALPLMSGSGSVKVLLVDPEPTGDGHGDEPGADIARHLSRWREDVEVVREPASGKSTGDCLQDMALARGADLLVMGGYGHSRMWEMLLGGATREVLVNTRLPVMLSH